MPVISMQPYGQLGGALIGAGIGFGISPLAQAGLDEPFGLAVGLRRVRLGADVLEAEVSASLSEIEGSVAGAVVGHDAADGDAEAGVVGHRRLEERDGAFLALGDRKSVV